MKVLVTGAGGFIGSHVTELCLERGHEVRAFVRYNSRGSLGWLAGSAVCEQADVVAGDVRDPDVLHQAMRGVDAVIHLAALIGIPYSFVSPSAYVDTNIRGTFHVLEAARSHDVANVVILSTSEVYGNATSFPIAESHPQNAHSPYAATKIAADQLALSYHRSFGLPVKIARPFNTYGPRQSARAIIPTIATQLLSGAREIRLGNLHPTRDLTFVRDTAAGLLAIAESDGLVGETTHIGMNEEISIGDLARLIAEVLGRALDIEVTEERTRPSSSEVDRLRCDNSRLLAMTAWRPAHTLRSGLQSTIDWLTRNLSAYRPTTYAV